MNTIDEQFKKAKQAGNIKFEIINSGINFTSRDNTFIFGFLTEDKTSYMFQLNLFSIKFHTLSTNGWACAIVRNATEPITKIVDENIVEITPELKEQLCNSTELTKWFEETLSKLAGDTKIYKNKRKDFDGQLVDAIPSPEKINELIDNAIKNFKSLLNISKNNDAAKKHVKGLNIKELQKIATEIGKDQVWDWYSMWKSEHDPYNGSGKAQLWDVFDGTYMKENKSGNIKILDAENALRKLAAQPKGFSITYNGHNAKWTYTREK